MRCVEIRRDERFKGRLGKLRQLISLGGVWSDLLLAQLADRGAERLVFLTRPIHADKITHVREPIRLRASVIARRRGEEE